MRLESVWFEVKPPGGERTWPVEWYARHARVLEYSARAHCPGEVNVRRVPPPPPSIRAARGGSAAVSYAFNTYKLGIWREIVEGARDGEQLLLIDADTVILRPLEPVWDLEFDVAYTVKGPGARIPINAGVIFLRATERARAFIRAWDDWNGRLLRDGILHRRWWGKYAGMNQAALGALLENGGGQIADLRELRCEEWNCESATWETFDRADPPRIVHVKGAMRRHLMDPEKYPTMTPRRKQIAAIWWALERDALAAEAAKEGAGAAAV